MKTPEPPIVHPGYANNTCRNVMHMYDPAAQWRKNAGKAWFPLPELTGDWFPRAVLTGARFH